MRCGSGAVGEAAIRAGRIQDPAAVGGALRQLLARTEITQTRAFVAASDTLATFRVLRCPAGSTDNEIAALVSAEVQLDPERIATRWNVVGHIGNQPLIYAVAWDRAVIRGIVDAAKAAGVEAAVIDLRSACLARVAVEPSCVIVDLSSTPFDMVLVDGYIPQVWHGVERRADSTIDLASLDAPLRELLRYYRSRHDGAFPAVAPVLVSGEQEVQDGEMAALSHATGHPVAVLPAPARIPSHVRHSSYLACIGLMMRRGE